MTRQRFHSTLVACCAASILAWGLASPGFGYPLDGWADTGIDRLEAYRLAQTGKIRARLLPPGGRLPGSTIELRLREYPDFAIPPPDPEFSAEVGALLLDDADAYGLVILDLTDPLRPRLAVHNPDMAQNPASVGKLMVGLGWMQTLADVYPDNPDARDALMRSTQVSADGFIRTDSHDVPIWHPGEPRVDYRPLRIGDQGNLWTWLDWMLSSSSNAAASTIIAQTILLKHFGAAYPVSPEAAARFFRDTPQSTLSGLLRETLQRPITRNGLDLDKLRQGSFFTREGKNRIPGTTSTSTPMELLKFMVQMEQGQLVDPYSSLALKRLVYLSERRIRYASTLALRRAAVYFKSGSWFTCKPEKGFQCDEYKGNVRNFLNSVVAVETQPPARKLHYIVVLLSNVLRKDSAEIHRNLATEIHEMIDAYHAGEGEASSSNSDSDWGVDASAEANAGPIDEMDSDEETESDQAAAEEEVDALELTSEGAD